MATVAAVDERKKENKRERARIASACVRYEEDHCCWTVRMYVEGADGGGQGFPVLLDSEEDALDMAADIAKVFGVSFDETHTGGFASIVGKECWVLRPFGYLNDQIEGFEVDGGQRFTRTDWLRKREPKAPSRLALEERRLKADIRRYRGQLMEARKKLRTLEDDYTEWAAT